MTAAKRRTIPWLAAVVMAVLGALVAFGIRRARVEQSFTIRPIVPQATRCEYDFEWTGVSGVRLGSAAAGGGSGELRVNTQIGGSLHVTHVADERSDRRYLLTFAPRASSRIAVSGSSVIAGDALERSLAPARAMLTLGPSGAVAQLELADDASHVMELVARAMAARLIPIHSGQAGADWRVTLANEVGSGPVSFHAESARHLLRRRTTYETLSLATLLVDVTADVKEAEADWDLAEDGKILRVTDKEDVTLRNASREVVGRVESNIRAQLVACAPVEVSDPTPRTASWREANLAQPLVGGVSSPEDRLARRVAGLTFDEMIAGLERFAFAESDPDRSAFLVRATGLLIEHPEYCAGLVPLVGSPGLDVKGRTLVLDVLASVGHDAAQAAMREALELPIVRRRADDYGLLVQRFSFVQNPDSETLAWLTRHCENDRLAAAATAASLGSAAGRLAGRDATADRAIAMLLDKTAAARSPQQRADLLVALGNVRSPLVSKTIVLAAHAPEAKVRDAAAFALRAVDSSEARETLVDLAHDSAPAVALSAFAALDAQKLEESSMRALLQAIIEGKTPPLVDSTAVTYLAKHASESPYVADALMAIAARAPEEEVRARAVAALRALGRAE